MALRGFQERKILRRVVFSVPVVLALWGIVIWVAWNTIALWEVKMKISQRNNGVAKELTNAKESREAIEQKTESLKSEYGIDLEARSKFNLTKPGEKVVVFADEQNKKNIDDKNKNLLGSIWSSLTDLLNFKNDEE